MGFVRAKEDMEGPRREGDNGGSQLNIPDLFKKKRISWKAEKQGEETEEAECSEYTSFIRQRDHNDKQHIDRWSLS